MGGGCELLPANYEDGVRVRVVHDTREGSLIEYESPAEVSFVAMQRMTLTLLLLVLLMLLLLLHMLYNRQHRADQTKEVDNRHLTSGLPVSSQCPKKR